MASNITSARHRRRSGGNVLLESVFTFLPIFALIFACADFGLMLYRWCTLQNAVREGCRYAITFQRSGVLGQDASIQAVVQQYSLGLVASTDTPQHIYVRYFSPGNMTTPIGSGGNIPGNIVEVSVQNASWSWIVPLSGTASNSSSTATPLAINVYASDVMGGYPAGVNNVPR